ncbi:MAG TPA: HDOD domain-containing protein, partial [Burkholderiaceae bacterium]|nr:HDOD domain-containing protein [Burkholderiaceae bacterium]
GRAGRVTTISKAILLLGFDAIWQLAMSFELLQAAREGTGPAYERACLHALRAANLARTFAPAAIAEDATVCALIRASGALACALVAPNEYDSLLERGVSDRVANGLARAWKLPERLVYATEPCRSATLAPPSIDEHLKSLSACAMQLAQLPGPIDTARMQTLWTNWQAAHGCEREAFTESMTAAIAKADSWFEAALGRPAGSVSNANDGTDEAQDAEQELDRVIEAAHRQDPADSRSARLLQGLADVQAGVADGHAPKDLCRMLLESLHHAMHAQVSMFFLETRGRYLPWITFGLDAAEARGWGFTTGAAKADIVQAALARRTDLYLHDTHDPQLRKYIPAWLDKAFPNPGALLVLPIHHGNAPVALVVCVSRETGLKATQDELSTLGVLKAQALSLLRSAHAQKR